MKEKVAELFAFVLRFFNYKFDFGDISVSVLQISIAITIVEVSSFLFAGLIRDKGE